MYLHLIHGFLGARPTPNSISIGSAVFAGLTVVINTHTHKHT